MEEKTILGRSQWFVWKSMIDKKFIFTMIGTILLILFTNLSIAQELQNPHNSANYIALAADAGGAILPGVTGLGIAVRTAKGADKALEIATTADKLSDGVQGVKALERGKDAEKAAQTTTQTVADSGKLRGSANPEIKSSIQDGLKEHQNLYEQKSVEGFLTNKQIPGTTFRPDAYDPATKTIIELKPDSPSGLRAGQKQIDKYTKAAEGYFGGKWKSFVQTYKSKYKSKK